MAREAAWRALDLIRQRSGGFGWCLSLVMSRKTKLTILSLIGALVLFFAIITWFYPYSSLSLHRSISYSPDPYLVEDYTEKMNGLSKKYAEGSGDDPTMDRLQYILQMYDQEWLMSEKAVVMTKEDLDNVAFDVKEARNVLIDLSFEETYSADVKKQLRLSIENCLAIEESVEELKDANLLTRDLAQIQYGNLHGTFDSSLRTLGTMYARYEREIEESE
ncbi:hypothetical protein [Guptibacillus hwajinpoensis]|uniref:hypothetical protein n=1 Tax=Guptibacillus hwajinpoensis TaxID=208199 RepID=UPI0024B33C49|nr:hypothetical protein [Pseudalkalibacillus hwajinpoensis]